MPPHRPADESPYQRLTVRAKAVLVFAQQQAEDAGDAFVGTVHLLLGLILEADGLAARALRDLGVTEERVRTAAILDGGTRQRVAGEPVAPTAAVEAVVGAAVAEALSSGSVSADTQHLLLALVDSDDPAAQLLAGLGADRPAVREELARPARPAPPTVYPPPSGRAVVAALPGAAHPAADVAPVLLARAAVIAQRRREQLSSAHVLVALAEEADDPAGRILGAHGLSAAAVEALLDDPGG